MADLKEATSYSPSTGFRTVTVSSETPTVSVVVSGSRISNLLTSDLRYVQETGEIRTTEPIYETTKPMTLEEQIAESKAISEKTGVYGTLRDPRTPQEAEFFDKLKLEAPSRIYGLENYLPSEERTSIKTAVETAEAKYPNRYTYTPDYYARAADQYKTGFSKLSYEQMQNILDPSVREYFTSKESILAATRSDKPIRLPDGRAGYFVKVGNQLRFITPQDTPTPFITAPYPKKGTAGYERGYTGGDRFFGAGSGYVEGGIESLLIPKVSYKTPTGTTVDLGAGAKNVLVLPNLLGEREASSYYYGIDSDIVSKERDALVATASRYSRSFLESPASVAREKPTYETSPFTSGYVNTVDLRSALLKADQGQALTSAEKKTLSDYFGKDGYKVVSQTEYERRVSQGDFAGIKGALVTVNSLTGKVSIHSLTASPTTIEPLPLFGEERAKAFEAGLISSTPVPIEKEIARTYEQEFAQLAGAATAEGYYDPSAGFVSTSKFRLQGDKYYIDLPAQYKSALEQYQVKTGYTTDRIINLIGSGRLHFSDIDGKPTVQTVKEIEAAGNYILRGTDSYMVIPDKYAVTVKTYQKAHGLTTDQLIKELTLGNLALITFPRTNSPAIVSKNYLAYRENYSDVRSALDVYKALPTAQRYAIDEYAKNNNMDKLAVVSAISTDIDYDIREGDLNKLVIATVGKGNGAYTEIMTVGDYRRAEIRSDRVTAFTTQVNEGNVNFRLIPLSAKEQIKEGLAKPFLSFVGGRSSYNLWDYPIEGANILGSVFGQMYSTKPPSVTEKASLEQSIKEIESLNRYYTERPYEFAAELGTEAAIAYLFGRGIGAVSYVPRIASAAKTSTRILFSGVGVSKSPASVAARQAVKYQTEFEQYSKAIAEIYAKESGGIVYGERYGRTLLDLPAGTKYTTEYPIRDPRITVRDPYGQPTKPNIYEQWDIPLGTRRSAVDIGGAKTARIKGTESIAGEYGGIQPYGEIPIEIIGDIYKAGRYYGYMLSPTKPYTGYSITKDLQELSRFSGGFREGFSGGKGSGSGSDYGVSGKGGNIGGGGKFENDILRANEEFYGWTRPKSSGDVARTKTESSGDYGYGAKTTYKYKSATDVAKPSMRTITEMQQLSRMGFVEPLIYPTAATKTSTKQSSAYASPSVSRMLAEMEQFMFVTPIAGEIVQEKTKTSAKIAGRQIVRPEGGLWEEPYYGEWFDIGWFRVKPPIEKPPTYKEDTFFKLGAIIDTPYDFTTREFVGEVYDYMFRQDEIFRQDLRTTEITKQTPRPRPEEEPRPRPEEEPRPRPTPRSGRDPWGMGALPPAFRLRFDDLRGGGYPAFLISGIRNWRYSEDPLDFLRGIELSSVKEKVSSKDTFDETNALPSGIKDPLEEMAEMGNAFMDYFGAEKQLKKAKGKSNKSKR